jgi:galactokinase
LSVISNPSLGVREEEGKVASPHTGRTHKEGCRTSHFTAPARVNLLGEHTDYTGGLVLPMAIPFTTNVSITPRDDAQYSFASDRFAQGRTMSLADRSEAVGDWSDYPVGVLRMLQRQGLNPPGFTLQLSGNVPFGAGVSSSASVEVATAYALLAHANAELSVEEIATLCRAAENDYVHSPCGIMDQFAITAARAGHALLLNTRTLRYEHLPMNTGDLSQTQIVVCNSMVKHSVAAGEYGVRHREVMEGQAVLVRETPGVAFLGEATPAQLERCRAKMTPESYLRCRHIVRDNGRVAKAKEAMFAGNPEALGRLMVEGHASERDDFACSCEEVDFLVETAIALPGCFGARLTGGGFGGCTVNLVVREQVETFSAALKAAYKNCFNIEPETYICDAVDGAAYRNAPAMAQPA